MASQAELTRIGSRLALDKLPAKYDHIRKAVSRYRSELEDAVTGRFGSISAARATLIQGACRHECLARLWAARIRDNWDKMSDSQRNDASDRLSRETDRRDAAVKSLELDQQPKVGDVSLTQVNVYMPANSRETAPDAIDATWTRLPAPDDVPAIPEPPDASDAATGDESGESDALFHKFMEQVERVSEPETANIGGLDDWPEPEPPCIGENLQIRNPANTTPDGAIPPTARMVAADAGGFVSLGVLAFRGMELFRPEELGRIVRNATAEADQRAGIAKVIRSLNRAMGDRDAQEDNRRW